MRLPCSKLVGKDYSILLTPALVPYFLYSQYYSAPPAYEAVLKHLNTAFTVIFSVECILKIMAFGLLVREERTGPELETPFLYMA